VTTRPKGRRSGQPQESPRRASRHKITLSLVIGPYEIATVYAGLGEKDAAFRALEKSVEDRADCIPWIKADSKIDPLRSDARDARLIRRIGLAP